MKDLKKITSEKEFLDKEKEYVSRLTSLMKPHSIARIMRDPKSFNDEFVSIFNEMEYIGLISDEDREKYVAMYLSGINMPESIKYKIVSRFKSKKGSTVKKLKSASQDVSDYVKEN